MKKVVTAGVLLIVAVSAGWYVKNYTGPYRQVTTAENSSGKQDYPFQVQPHSELVHLFDYDSKLPLEAKARTMVQHSGITVQDISYTSPLGGQPTSAYLVLPEGKGPFPAIMFVHSNGGRDASLPQAIMVARMGGIALALQPADLTPLAASMRREVIDIRRAYDLLAERADVDSKRIGYVGHSFGAMMGSVVAGVDKRFRCFVLEGGNLGMTYHVRFTQHPQVKSMRLSMSARQLAQRLVSMAPYDAVHYIGHAAPTPLLIQAAHLDVGVSEQEYLDFYTAASEPKQLKWYETGHEMAYDPAVLKDRLEFLAQNLSLSAPAGNVLLQERTTPSK